MIRSVLCAIVLLPLAACGSGKDGATITINSSGADGNVLADIGGNGEATIDTPFFKGKVKIPKLKLDASNFDMNGVHLYPGSTISTMNVDAHDRPGKDDDGTVRVSFASPAAPGVVRDWFRDKLTGAGFTLDNKGEGLAGKTNEGQPFSLDLVPDGTSRTKGVISIG